MLNPIIHRVHTHKNLPVLMEIVYSPLKGFLVGIHTELGIVYRRVTTNEGNNFAHHAMNAMSHIELEKLANEVAHNVIHSIQRAESKGESDDLIKDLRQANIDEQLILKILNHKHPQAA